MIEEYRAFGGMKIHWGNHSARRTLAPVSLCPPPLTHDLKWDWTQAAIVGSWCLTAHATALSDAATLINSTFWYI
jgi:hypothetical protein